MNLLKVISKRIIGLGLVSIGQDVYVISPYYDHNRKGETGYLAKDPAGITYQRNVVVKVGGGTYSLGAHTGVVSGVKLIFLHNAELYPVPYPEGNAATVLRQIAVFCKVVYMRQHYYRHHWNISAQYR